MTLEEHNRAAAEEWAILKQWEHVDCGGVPVTVAVTHVTCTGCQYREPFDGDVLEYLAFNSEFKIREEVHEQTPEKVSRKPEGYLF